MKPTVTVTVTPDPTSPQAIGGLSIELLFDESMDVSVEPTVTYDPAGDTGSQACTGGSWSTTTNTNDTYTVSNDSVIDSSTGDGTAELSVSVGRDAKGNTMDADTDHTFVIDTVVATLDTVTATSVHGAGDTIVCTFSEAMDTTTLTNANLASNLSIDYSDDQGNLNSTDISLTNATVVWSNGDQTATITLDEATDEAYIPNNKYIGVAPIGGAVTDLAGNSVTDTEIYTSSVVPRESTAPTISVAATSVHGAGDTITITSDEVLYNAGATSIGNWTVEYDDDDAAGGETVIVTTNASVELDATGKIATITLNEGVDGAYIPDAKYVKVTPDPSNIRDLVGNSSVSADYTAGPIAAETTVPNFTVEAVSVHSGGDTVTLTFDESITASSITNGCSSLYINLTDDTIGGGRTAVTTSNATVSWNTAQTVCTITLNEEIDGSFIPDGKYMEVRPVTAAVVDLVGNAVESYERYTSGTVSKETTLPVVSNTSPAASSGTNSTEVSYTLSEICSSGTITWTRTGGSADGNSPHVQVLVSSELTEGGS